MNPRGEFHSGTLNAPSSLSLLSAMNDRDEQMSLSVNYIPSKFSSVAVPSGVRNRKSARSSKTNEFDVQRFSEFFEDDDPKKKGQMRWNKFKWTLFVANTLLTIYSILSLIFCLLTWFNIFTHADVIRVGNRTELIVSTIAAGCGIFTCVIGWAGILLNDRSFLAIYTFLLWITFAFLVVPGYISYRTRTYNIEGKINAQWSQRLGTDGRARIQNQLLCCGYFSPFVEATVTQTCYARSVLPGCKAPYIDFEKMVLKRWFIVAFSLVPVHIFVMVAGLLCSNHVTYRFGKGMMPKAYRMSEKTMRVLMDTYKNQLVAQYGSEQASQAYTSSKPSGSSTPASRAYPSNASTPAPKAYPSNASTPAPNAYASNNEQPSSSAHTKSKSYFPPTATFTSDRETTERPAHYKRSSESRRLSKSQKTRDWDLPLQREEFAPTPEPWGRSRSPPGPSSRNRDRDDYAEDRGDRINSSTLNFYGYNRSNPNSATTPNTATSAYPFAQEYQPKSSDKRNFF